MAKAEFEPWRSLSRARALSHHSHEDGIQMGQLGSGGSAPLTPGPVFMPLGQAVCSARAVRVLGRLEAAGVLCTQGCDHDTQHIPWSRELWARAGLPEGGLERPRRAFRFIMRESRKCKGS